MSHETASRKRSGWFRPALAAALALLALAALPASAQVPARFYWKSLSGANGVPLIVNSMSGNTNPFDPSHTVNPGSRIDGTLAMIGYAHTFTLLDRSGMAAVIVPMGRLSGEVTLGGVPTAATARGFGDPMVEVDLNLVGPTAQKNLVDVVRYEPGFSLDVLVDLAIPIGEYDSDQPLNIGQNRWYGRVGFPIVWQLGPWVPGRRTTVELLPAVWLFGTNDDFSGHVMKTDPLFQVDAHLTHDFTAHAWGSLDGAWYTGAKASVNGVEGQKLDNLTAGITLGYQLNDNMSLTFGYKSTFNDRAPGDLSMDGFMVSFVTGWHSIIEGAKRLKAE